MAERPTKEVKKQLAKEVTSALIDIKNANVNKKSKIKYSKLIVWDIGMKDILEYEASKRGLSVTALIKHCVAKELSK